MKLLKKIRLINWGYFCNEVIGPLNGNIGIYGVNGSGKSALADAIYFVMSGGDSRHFNTAANTSSARTIESYMKGKTGVEGQEFQRSGAVISHIALEFLDTNTDEPFVIGTVLEIGEESNSKANVRFYTAFDVSVDDLEICIRNPEKKVMNFRAMKSQAERNRIEIEPLENFVSRKIAMIFGIPKADKYKELLLNAKAFKPIESIEKYVTNYLLPEKNIDIDKLTDDTKALRELRILSENEKEKYDSLVEIRDNGLKWREKSSLLTVLELYKCQIDIAQKEKRLSESIERKNRHSNQKAENEKILESLEKLLEEIQQQKTIITTSASYLAIEKDKRCLDEEKNREKALSQKVNEFNAGITGLTESARRLGFRNTFAEIVRDQNYVELKAALDKFADFLNKGQKDKTRQLYDKSRIADELEKQHEELLGERDKLKQGLHPYPPNVVKLMEYLQNGLSERYGRENVAVRPVCEVIEIDPECESWRNAIEGQLGDRRFDLLVSREHFREAERLYWNFNKEGCRGEIGLIDVEAANSANSANSAEKETGGDSILSKLRTDNPAAAAYLRKILGNVKAVPADKETIPVISCGHEAMDETGMAFVASSLRQGSLEACRKPYIGTNSLKLQLEAVEKKLEEAEAAITLVRSEISALENDLREIDRAHALWQSLNVQENHWQLLKDCREKIVSLEKELKVLEDDNPDIFAQIKQYEDSEKAHKEKKRVLQKLNEELSTEIGSLSARIDNLNETLDGLKAAQSEKLKDSALRSAFNAYLADHGKATGREDAQIAVLTDEIRHLERVTCQLMGKYINAHTFSATPDMDSLDTFISQLNTVTRNNMINYKAKMDELYKQSQRSFQDSYIFAIKSKIEETQTYRTKVNRILRAHPFGTENEIYSFEILPCKDKELELYKKIITSGKEFTPEDLFVDVISEEEKQTMLELFNKITETPTTEAGIREFKRLTDYRSFMSYDIKITNKKGEVSYFSKICREKSGGETQTPFYVLMAASFDQLSGESLNNDSGCVVILDEAFNNMDENHIQATLDYFKQLNIQLLIIITPEKVPIISTHVDTLIGLSQKIDENRQHRVVIETITGTDKDEVSD